MGRIRSLHVLAFLALSGCSLGIQAPDPARPVQQVPRCDTGKTAVALDGILATGFALGSIAAFDHDENGTGLALLATGGLFLASAMRGNSAANECHEAFASYTTTLAQRQRAPIDDDPQPSVGARPRPPAPPPPPPPPAAPIVASPTPEVAPEPPPPAPKPAAKPAAKPTPVADDDWSAFWKELP